MSSGALHFETPVLESAKLSARSGKRILLKMECYQPVSSFKIRGMGRMCQSVVEAGARHLFSSSGGNAGYAVAYAGRKLGVPVTVVIPNRTSDEVCRIIESEHARVIRHGDVWDDAHEEAMRLSARESGGYIHPFDHPTIWAGHATLIDECVRQCEPPEVLVVSVGGGGLFCGIMEGLQRHAKWRETEVIAVETEGADSLASSLKANRLVTLDRIASIATTLGAKRVTPKALEWAKTEQVTCMTVSDAQAIDASYAFANDHRVLVEPACGAALSVVYENVPVLAGADSVLVIVCGGVGVDLPKLNQWKTDVL